MLAGLRADWTAFFLAKMFSDNQIVHKGSHCLIYSSGPGSDGWNREFTEGTCSVTDRGSAKSPILGLLTLIAMIYGQLGKLTTLTRYLEQM